MKMNCFTYQDVDAACIRAFRDHGGKREVCEFKADYEVRSHWLLSCLQDGSWVGLIKYRKITKVNNNGKVRHIDSPDLNTRIYQHLALVKLLPLYNAVDPGSGLNCKEGAGITASDRRKSVVAKLKHVFYDRRDLQFYLVIDQRRCYPHSREKVARRALKRLGVVGELNDFVIRIGFVDGQLPIGTPLSPTLHHIMMLDFDRWAESLGGVYVRYADDCFFGFATLEEAQQGKWRVRMWWWYTLQMRAKAGATIAPFSVPLDFCGYRFHRNEGRTASQHDKGYTGIRRATLRRARACFRDESWASYFGIMRHADCWGEMRKIEANMKLSAITEKIRIDRSMDAPHIDIRDIEGREIAIYNYEIRRGKDGAPNWIKCLIGIDEVVDGQKTGKVLAFEFHGNYQGIIAWIVEAEKAFGKEQLLPIEEAVVTNQCGYIFENSTNQIKFIEPCTKI